MNHFAVCFTPTRLYTSHGAEQAESVYTKTLRVAQAELFLDRIFSFGIPTDIVQRMSSDANPNPNCHANANTAQHPHAFSNADTARFTFANVCADTRGRH